MKGKTFTSSWLLGFWILWCGSCGAFSDAAGGEEQEPTLAISPQSIAPGETKQLSIEFTKHPSWGKNASAYLTSISFGEDLGYNNANYDGGSNITAIVYANAEAKAGRRRVDVSVSFGQEHVSAYGIFYVIDTSQQSQAHEQGQSDGGSLDGKDQEHSDP